MLVVAKLNEHNCRTVIATNFTHSFCGSALVKSLKFKVRDLANPPAATTSDGTPIEFLSETMVLIELGPWQSDGLVPLLVAWDCPADLLIGQDLINLISKKYPVKFEYSNNAVNIGGTRVSMLDPLAAEKKFISVVVVDPQTKKEVNIDHWRKGNKEAVTPGGLVKRRVEVKKNGEEDEPSVGLQEIFDKVDNIVVDPMIEEFEVIEKLEMPEVNADANKKDDEKIVLEGVQEKVSGPIENVVEEIKSEGKLAREESGDEKDCEEL